MNILQSLADDAMRKKQQLQQQAGRVVHNVAQQPVQQATAALPHVASTALNYATFGQANNIGKLANNTFQTEGNLINRGIQHLPQPVIRPVANFAADMTVRPLLQTGQHIAQLTQNRNPYQGTARQQTGQVGTDLLSLASVLPLGKAVQGAKAIAQADRGAKLTTRIAQGAKTGAVHGALPGAAYGGAQQTLSAMQQNQATPDVIQAGIRGAEFGSLAGTALGGLAGATAPLVGDAAHIAAQGGRAVAKGGKAVAHGVDVAANKVAAVPEAIAHQQLIKNDPYYRTYHEQATQLQQNFDRNTANGLSEKNPAQIQLSRQIQALSGKTADMRQAMVQNAKQKVVDFAQEHPVGLTSGAVNDAGERLKMNGKPLKTAVATPAKPTLPRPGVAEQSPKLIAKETSAVSQAKPKTGMVDKQLQEIQKAHKDVIKYTADEIQQAAKPQGGIIDQIGKHGVYVGKDGLPEDYRDLPVHLRSTDPNKPTLDTVATNLGFHNEDELIKAIQENATSKSMTRAEALAEAEKQLESGKHPYSGDYQQIKDALNKRTDELAQYPNGKYRQVKVTAKPQTMTDAELQSLSQTPEGMQPKGTNKVLQRDDKKAIRNADAERTTQDMLKKGATTDEVLHAYMKATSTDLQTAVRDVRRVAKESNIGFGGGKNPLEGKMKVPTVQAGDADQAFLNADYVKQHEQRVGKDALDSFHNLSDHDKTLLQDIETDTVPNVAKRANNPEAFSQAEKAIRTYYDTRHAYDKYLGIDVGYRQNYLRQLFDKAKETIATTEQTPIKGGNKRPGYTQERSFDTLHTEVGNALERDVNGASANHAKLAYAKGLHEAFPSQINDSGTLVRDSTGNHLQLTNRYGQGLTAQKDLANQLNRRSWTPDTSKGLMAYDKVNAGLKYIKLGGGAFHALTEAGNFVGQQITSGKIFKNPTASGKVLKTFFSPKTMDKEMTGFRANGTLDNAALSGLKVQAHEILADANVKLGGKLSKYSGIQALHDATFQREIPYAKLKLFEQHTEGLDAHKPADLKQMRSVAAGINDLFGGINRDISGSITPGAFKRLQRVVLATDFTESKIRTAFRGINVTDKSPAAKLARQAIIGKVALFAGLAAAGGAAGGEFNGKDAKQTAQNILGKLIDPSFTFGKYKVGLPATHVSEFTKPITPLFRTDGGDRFSGLQHYATNRLAAVPSEGLQIRSNKDSSGSRIYGKDYKANGGKPISPAQTAINIGKGVVPIPVAQGTDVARGKTPLAGAIANTIGLRVSDPGSFTKQTPSTATNTTSQIKTAFNTPEGKQFMALSDTEKKVAAQNDPNARALYDQYQAMKKGLTPSTDLRAADLSPESTKTLDHIDHLTSEAKDKLFARQPDAEYQYQLAKYENDKKSGTLSRTDDIRRQQALSKAKVGTQFSKDTRDTYGLSKQEVYDLITQDPDGNKIAQDLLAYGDALEQSGLGKNKFRTSKGAVRFGTASSSGGSSSSEITKMLAAFKTPYSDLVKSSTKGAQLARSAGLAKRSS